MSDPAPKTFNVTLAKAASRSTPFGTMRAGRPMAVKEGSPRHLYFKARPRDFVIVDAANKVPRPARRGPPKLEKAEDRSAAEAAEKAAAAKKAEREEAAREAAGSAPDWAKPPFDATPSFKELMKHTKSQLAAGAQALGIDRGFDEEATKKPLAAEIQLHIAAVRGEDPPKAALEILG